MALNSWSDIWLESTAFEQKRQHGQGDETNAPCFARSSTDWDKILVLSTPLSSGLLAAHDCCADFIIFLVRSWTSSSIFTLRMPETSRFHPFPSGYLSLSRWGGRSIEGHVENGTKGRTRFKENSSRARWKTEYRRKPIDQTEEINVPNSN
jgi:hypothetical protein